MPQLRGGSPSGSSLSDPGTVAVFAARVAHPPPGGRISGTTQVTAAGRVRVAAPATGRRPCAGYSLVKGNVLGDEAVPALGSASSENAPNSVARLAVSRQPSVTSNCVDHTQVAHRGHIAGGRRCVVGSCRRELSSGTGARLPAGPPTAIVGAWRRPGATTPEAGGTIAWHPRPRTGYGAWLVRAAPPPRPGPSVGRPGGWTLAVGG
jgi:hypothetical protein